MSKLFLKIQKTKHVNPSTGKKGFVARIITNGTAGFEEIAEDACENTTMHKAEAQLAFGLCIDAIVERLKQGMIIDLGPLGKLYPSCSSGWTATEEELSAERVKPSLNFRPSNELDAAIKSATLQWTNAEKKKEVADGKK